MLLQHPTLCFDLTPQGLSFLWQELILSIF
jgi:hypothetical protein